LNGDVGCHHTSVERFCPVVPSASIVEGKSSAFPIVATFGLYPCCTACFQKVPKSGGIGTPRRTSALAALMQRSVM